VVSILRAQREGLPFVIVIIPLHPTCHPVLVVLWLTSSRSSTSRIGPTKTPGVASAIRLLSDYRVPHPLVTHGIVAPCCARATQNAQVGAIPKNRQKHETPLINTRSRSTLSTHSGSCPVVNLAYDAMNSRNVNIVT